MIFGHPKWCRGGGGGGGYEIAQADDFWHTRASYVWYVKNRQPVLFQSHPGQMGEHEHPNHHIVALFDIVYNIKS